MWTIYSKNNCIYCDKAKHALRDQEVEVKNVEENRDFFAELLSKVPNARSMPQVFRGDEYIGGFTELEKLLVKEQIESFGLSL